MKEKEAHSRLLEQVWHGDRKMIKKEDEQADCPVVLLPMQNHGPHEHSQVDQTRQGHGRYVAYCSTQRKAC